MTVPTIAECRKADVCSFSPSRSSAISNSAAAVQNIITTSDVRLKSDAGNQDYRVNHYVSFIRPNVADYASAKFGDRCTVLLVDSTVSSVVYDAEEWLYTAGGWVKLLSAGQATSGASAGYPVYTGTSEKVLDIRAKFTTAAGTNRAIYIQTNYNGTTAQGESVRAYSQITSTATSVHGVYATAEVSTAGSVVGQAIAGRFTAATVTGLTLSAGSLYAITAQTDNVSSALSMTDSAHIRIEDLNTFGMNSIFSLGTIVGRSTNKAAPGPYTYVSGHMTLGNCDGAIRVKTPDGTFYIPLIVSFS
jgi:hypothetical protein